jgi:hypothetical protein
MVMVSELQVTIRAVRGPRTSRDQSSGPFLALPSVSTLPWYRSVTHWMADLGPQPVAMCPLRHFPAPMPSWTLILRKCLDSE